MGNIFKILIVTAPIAALLFYYVVIKQSQIHTEVQKENARFEREWNEFNEDSLFRANKERYRERAEEAEAELKELKEKEKMQQQKVEKFENEFEEELKKQNQELEKQANKGGK